MQNKTDWALKNYLDAVELGERDPQIIRQTLQLLFDKQRYYDADRLLRRVAKATIAFLARYEPGQCGARRAAGRVPAALGDCPENGCSRTKDYQDHLWLGQILSVIGRQAKTAGQTKRPRNCCSKRKRPSVARWNSSPRSRPRGSRSSSSSAPARRKSQAEKVIAEVSQKIPAKQVPLALAQCYEAMQDFDAAQKKYEVALAADPQDAVVVRAAADFYFRTRKSALAEVQLKRIIEGKLRAPEADVFWARRELALIVANRGGYQNFQRARELIDKNLATAEASVLDRRARAIIDVSDPVRSRRKEGIHMLETMVQDQIATSEDRYELAQMYLAAGNWIQASIQFRNLVASYGSEPRYLAAYVLALLDHGEIINAELYLDRLATTFSQPRQHRCSAGTHGAGEE